MQQVSEYFSQTTVRDSPPPCLPLQARDLKLPLVHQLRYPAQSVPHLAQHRPAPVKLLKLNPAHKGLGDRGGQVISNLLCFSPSWLVWFVYLFNGLRTRIA